MYYPSIHHQPIFIKTCTNSQKSYEEGEKYKYSGARTVESLKETALKMLEPPMKDLSKITDFSTFNDRYTVSFLYIIADLKKKVPNTENSKIYDSIARKFRPDIPFYFINYVALKALYFNDNDKAQKKKTNDDFIRNNLIKNKEEIELEVLYQANGGSIIYAITQSLPNKQYKSVEFNKDDIIKFVEQNRFAPIIEMKLGNYKELVETCQYFGIIFVKGKDGKISTNAQKLSCFSDCF